MFAVPPGCLQQVSAVVKAQRCWGCVASPVWGVRLKGEILCCVLSVSGSHLSRETHGEPLGSGGWGCQDSGMAGGVLPMGFLQASRGIYGPRKKMLGSGS